MIPTRRPDILSIRKTFGLAGGEIQSSYFNFFFLTSIVFKPFVRSHKSFHWPAHDYSCIMHCASLTTFLVAGIIQWSLPAVPAFSPEWRLSGWQAGKSKVALQQDMYAVYLKGFGFQWSKSKVATSTQSCLWSKPRLCVSVIEIQSSYFNHLVYIN